MHVLRSLALTDIFSNFLLIRLQHRRPHPHETIFFAPRKKILFSRNLHFRFFPWSKKKNCFSTSKERVELFTVRVQLTQP